MVSEDRLDKKLYEIMAGKIECNIFGQRYYISSATPSLKIAAQNIYNDVLTDLQYSGLLTSDDFLDLILNNGWWTIKENNELNSINTIIDNLKLEMYNKYCSFQSKQIEKIRQTLNEKRNRYIQLFNKRHSNDYFTCEGQASLERTRFLINNCIFTQNNDRFVPENDWILSKIVELYMLNKPSEIDIRHIANSDNWRSIWTCGKISDVFGIPAILLSDEQKSLIGWSKLYDSIYEHPQSPDRKIIKDDDLLDGWLIAEQNKRESEKNNNINKNNNMADEIYIPAETTSDASRIMNQNSMESKLIQQQRLNILKKKGIIDDHKMPDMKLKIMEQQRQMNKRK